MGNILTIAITTITVNTTPMHEDTHDTASARAIPSCEDPTCNTEDMKVACHTCKDIMASCRENQQQQQQMDSFHRNLDGIIVMIKDTSMKDDHMVCLQ